MQPIAFVIGNGESRRGIDLNKLHERGKTFGCNALYRDFAPDYLGALDTAICEEIIQSGYADTHKFFCNIDFPGRKFEKLPASKWGLTGEAMIRLALQMSAEIIILVGFDFDNLHNRKDFLNALINNIYAGTPHYPETKYEVGNSNGISMMQDIMNEYFEIEFYSLGIIPRALGKRLKPITVETVYHLPVIKPHWR